MNKILTLVFVLFATTSFASESEEEMCMEAEPVVNSCYAETVCPYGGKVWCSATGDGCSWYVQPGRFVTCTGIINGWWQTVTFGC